jgi:hypothetical protein
LALSVPEVEEYPMIDDHVRLGQQHPPQPPAPDEDREPAVPAESGQLEIQLAEDDILLTSQQTLATSRKYVAYTVKLPSEQLAALQSIWLELKRMYGAHSPDKSGMIQLAIAEWLKRWDGPDKQALLRELLEIREDTRKRQYRKL